VSGSQYPDGAPPNVFREATLPSDRCAIISASARDIALETTEHVRAKNSHDYSLIPNLLRQQCD
jgi:hypothetical protein